jgi:hypothetical protein
MVSAITIASFLGIVVVALFIFFIYSQKEQIRKALKEKRAEKRLPTEVEVELATAHEPLSYEKSLAENTSRHGARVVTSKSWRLHDHVLVRLSQGDKSSRARIAYCTASAGDAFAVGLQFSSAVNDWLTSDSDMSDEDSSHLYRK